MQTFVVVNERNNEVIGSRIRLADTPKLRSKGLLGKKSLESGEGLMIRPCWSIHTAFMRFSLDVLYIDRQGGVMKVVSNLQPFRISGAWGARDTIELPAGALDGLDIRRGDRLAYRPVPVPVP